MNNTNYNQYNQYNQQPGMNQMPQQQAQPMYNAQPMNGAVPAQNSTSDFKQKLANMDMEQVKKIAGMVCGILLILSVFLPYISVRFLGSTSSISIMSADDTTLFKIVFLILSVLPIVTFFFQKGKRLSYLTSGFVLSFVISTLDASDGLKYLSFGFYFMLIASVVLLVLCIMEDIPELKTLFTSKPAVVGGTTTANVSMQVPPAMAPTAQPVQQMAGAQPVQPVVQTVEVCNYCGQPKRNPADVVCPSCGQRY